MEEGRTFTMQYSAAITEKKKKKNLTHWTKRIVELVLQEVLELVGDDISGYNIHCTKGEGMLEVQLLSTMRL